MVAHATRRRGWRWLAALGCALFGSCAGIFQRSAPAVPQEYAVRQDARSPLRVGSAERDITPPLGSYLAGFGMARRSESVGSPLRVRALVLEQDGRRFAIVGVDNLGLMREDTDWIKAGLPGFANGDVFLCSSHTHAGPDAIGLWGHYLLNSGRDRDYIGHVRAATAAAVAEALANAAPAQLRRGGGRLPPQGLVKNSNRPECFDRRVVVLHAQALDDGRPLGTLLHFACHPEVLPRRSTALSADFVGSLCDEWRARGHGQAVFVNGALGAMISPQGQSRDLAGVQTFGATACGLAEQALAAAEPVPVDAIEVRRRDVYVPIESLGFRLGQLTMALQRQLFDGAARSTVGWLRIGTFEAVALPGEMEPALAQRVRAELRRPDLVLFGLCDDELGYLLREQDARDPEYHYERTVSACLRAGEIVRAAITGRR